MYIYIYHNLIYDLYIIFIYYIYIKSIFSDISLCSFATL